MKNNEKLHTGIGQNLSSICEMAFHSIECPSSVFPFFLCTFQHQQIKALSHRLYANHAKKIYIKIKNKK